MQNLQENMLLLYKKLRRSNQQLYKANLKLHCLKERKIKSEVVEQDKKDRLTKKAKAKSIPRRQRLTSEGFSKIMKGGSNVYQNRLSFTRVKITFFLLTVTGLRISNLLLLITGMIRNLLEN